MLKASDRKTANDNQARFLQDIMRFEEATATDEELIELLSYTKRENVLPPHNPEKSLSNPDGIVDIITFCEHPYFLGLQLTPWQRLVVKAFYSGTDGNKHLQIDKTKSDTGCNGCVWHYNRKIEADYYHQMRDLNRASRPIEPNIPTENSPCLQCTRYGDTERDEYYGLLRDILSGKDLERLNSYSIRQIEDGHTSEWDMLNHEEIGEKVRTQIIDKWGEKFQELILVLGRRSGKSFMVSIIALYEVYRFLSMGHPQERYPLTPFDVINIVNIANSMRQAYAAIFEKMKSYCSSSPYFSQHIGKAIQGEIHFLTPFDRTENERRQKNGNDDLLTGTVQVISGHSNSATLVGLTAAIIIIDEMAEMAGNNAEGNHDEILYDKLKPSLATFGNDGKMICISNPLAPQGKFFNLYEASFDDPYTLMFQLPTWLSNPCIPKSWLEAQKSKSRRTYKIFYGAQFSAGAGDTFLDEDDVVAAFRERKDEYRQEFGVPLTHYFLHLDPAHSDNDYSLALVHAEPIEGDIGPDGRTMQRIVVDHIHYWEPRGPNHPVDQQEVDTYIVRLATRFHIVSCTYDQHWSSHASIAKLKSMGIPCSMTVFNGQFQRTIYQNLYELFVGRRIDFYGMNTPSCELPDGRMVSLVEAKRAKEEFLDLQRKYKGGGWKVEAAKGSKDDIPDCIAGAAYQAIKEQVFTRLPKSRSIGFNLWGSKTSSQQPGRSRTFGGR